jgi:hypothetical protein
VAKKANVVCVKKPATASHIDEVIGPWKAVLHDAMVKKRANTGVSGKKDKKVIINYSGTGTAFATLPGHRLYAN